MNCVGIQFIWINPKNTKWVQSVSSLFLSSFSLSFSPFSPLSFSPMLGILRVYPDQFIPTHFTRSPFMFYSLTRAKNQLHPFLWNYFPVEDRERNEKKSQNQVEILCVRLQVVSLLPLFIRKTKLWATNIVSRWLFYSAEQNPSFLFPKTFSFSL